MALDERSVGIVMIFIVTIILLSLGAIIVNELRNIDLDVQNRVSNDSISATQGQTVNLIHIRVNPTTVIVNSGYNQTGQDETGIIPAANYTATSSAITLNWANNTEFNVSYLYAHDVESGVVNVTNSGLAGLEATTELTGPLGITIFAAIILATLIGTMLLIGQRLQ